jgi:hypothetical protein
MHIIRRIAQERNSIVLGASDVPYNHIISARDGFASKVILKATKRHIKHK